MNVSKESLPDVIRNNFGRGIIVHNRLPYEVTLNEEGDVIFSGAVWSWEETELSSSHGDYLVEADTFSKHLLAEVPPLPPLSHYTFYRDEDEYLTNS